MLIISIFVLLTNPNPIPIFITIIIKPNPKTINSATFHVTPNTEWFSNYVAQMSGTIRLDNGQECKITEIEEVVIQLPNGNVITLHRVWHALTLKRSLVSIGMLAEDGY